MKRKLVACALVLACVMLQAMPATVAADDNGTTEVSGSVPLVTRDVSVSNIGYYSATISWKTNGDATSQVFYDTQFHDDIADYAYHTDEDATLVSEHSIALTGLASWTTYHYRVKSVIPDTDFTAISDDGTFRTSGFSSPPGIYQPDNQIRNHGETDYTGDDIYNTDGTDQTKSQAVTGNVTAIYEIKLQNDATGIDALNVTGTASGSSWTVIYYSVAEDADVTDLVTGGIWYTRTMPSGYWEEMRLEVTPDSTVPVGSSIEVLVTSTSAYGDTHDVVKAITTASSPPPDTTPPTIVSTSPATDAIDVAVDTVIVATFSEAMDSSTIATSSFTLVTDSTPVSGSVSYDSGTYTATFTPDANLAYSTTYTATLSTAITDAAGNPLAVAYGWSFTTVLPGDANGDGNVNALDITNVERIIARLDAETPGADANQDGAVNALDITKVERIIAGLDEPRISLLGLPFNLELIGKIMRIILGQEAPLMSIRTETLMHWILPR